MALAALLILLVVCLLVSRGPYHLYVNGQRLGISQVSTAADCAEVVGISLQTGRLLDARGTVLVFGGGESGQILCNSRPIPPAAAVQGGDIITIIPPTDKVEPIIEKISLLPGQALDTQFRSVPLPSKLSGFRGLRRVQRGKITGKVGAIEVAQVLPVVIPPANSNKTRAVALTFDDGPLPQYTPQILDILAAHGARATFFVLGHLAKRFPDIVRRAASEGHEIAIHSWAHANFTRLSTTAIQQDIQRCKELLGPLVGGHEALRWFRPPYGAKNARVEATIRGAGCRIAMWSVDPSDWRRPGSEAIYNRILNRTHNGAVILMHDGGGPRQGTVDAVHRVVPALQQQGYRLVTLSELKGMEPTFTGEVILTTGEGAIRLTPVAGELVIIIDGEPVQLPTVPLEAEGQLLLPPEPILRLLGASYRWDKQRQIVHISGLRGNLLLRLDSRRGEKNGQPITLRVPPVLYQKVPMIPLWAIVNITGAAARYDSQNLILRLTSPLRTETYFVPYLYWAGRQAELIPRPLPQ